MSLYVVDVSVGVKWMLPEPYSADALRLQTPAHQLHSPAFFAIELANILWKKIRRGLLTAPGGPLYGASPDTGGHAPRRPRVIDLGFRPYTDQTQRTVYDCLYLALALQLGGQMVTADEKLVNSLSGTPWAGAILRVQDLP